ncbi:MAG: hypothetical protein WC861_03820 [Candidatus Micrarchaeia archaeon]|jgi:hypothetical protein
MPAKKTNGNAIYSVKLEVGGATRIFTLRVGKDSTELSLVKDGKLVEILREEDKEVTHEKF